MSDKTLRIPDKQIDFIRLLERSADQGDGWRAVSDMLANFALKTMSEQPELYQFEKTETRLRIRLSDKGNVLKDYL